MCTMHNMNYKYEILQISIMKTAIHKNIASYPLSNSDSLVIFCSQTSITKC